MRRTLGRVILGSCCLLGVAANAQTITIAGSETVRPISDKWSQMYQRQEPTVTIYVVGGGSSVGFSSLQSGKAEIAQSSRRINPTEKQSIEAAGQRVRETSVATDAVVFYVHPSNPVKALTEAQIQNIFSGSIRNWRAVGGPDIPITVYGQDKNSGIGQFVKEVLLRDKDFSPTTLEFPNYSLSLAKLAEDRGGISYAGLGFVGKWKAIAIKDQGGVVEPSSKNIHSKRYPITRPLFLYTFESSGAAVQKFMRWVKTRDGQLAVEAAGFLPLSSEERAID